MDVLINEAPRWRRTLDPPTFVFQNRRVWAGFPAPSKRIIMVRMESLLLLIFV
jgi:hypothetical protein